MPNDAKLGLVLGIGLVIAIGVVFFRKEPSAGAPSVDAAPAAVTPVRAPLDRGQFRPARARATSQGEGDDPTGTPVITNGATESPASNAP
jgi:hypothetical protein